VAYYEKPRSIHLRPLLKYILLGETYSSKDNKYHDGLIIIIILKQNHKLWQARG
jgi:hypothetical protein